LPALCCDASQARSASTRTFSRRTSGEIRDFDISRKAGYKTFQRYKHCGLQGLTDRSRRPYRSVLLLTGD
jgi:hypothetical protein